MPHNPIDYSKTIIYKLCCNDLNITDIYIGHTTDFKSRKAQHKYSCNNINKSYNIKVYQFIRDNGGWDNWEMIMIEEYSCNNKLEAKKKERELIEELKASLNMSIPARTDKEYRLDNKEKINQKHKEYYENNKEIINEKQKEYRLNNKGKRKEYFKIYRENNKEKRKEKHKSWYENNKEIINEKQKEYNENNKEKRKEYYENNKEKILEKIKEKIKCDCGGCYTIGNKSTHFKTKIHINYTTL